jgi:L-ascorbate metabolism protein UlaG (beta-lactamase superfamily)
MSRRPKFTFLGHSTIRVDLDGGEVMLLEPWIQGNPSCPEGQKDLERLDVMLITHAHFDHMGDAVALAKRHEPKAVVGTFEVCQWLESQGVKNTSPMNLGGSQKVLGMRVSMVRADHSSGLSEDGSAPFVDGGTASGFVVKMPSGYTFYHAGDTALFSDMQLICELYRPELAFLPIGDRFTMDPHQAARACRFLGVREVIPIHWGTFPMLTGSPEDLGGELRNLGINCDMVRLEPGESF